MSDEEQNPAPEEEAPKEQTEQAAVGEAAASSDATAQGTAETSSDPWEDDPARALPEGEALVVDVEGFEGPLDLLLAMARTQKVDLAKISVLALAEQYLGFIHAARKVRLELAADYLVMAAWLTFIKSKLLLPPEEEEEDGPSGEEMAALLAFRLQRLDAMRDAAATLMTRKRLGRDVFPRGMPEPITVLRKRIYDANVYDLLKAYAQQRQRNSVTTIHMKKRTVWSIKEARTELERLLGVAVDWAPLDDLFAEFLVEPELRRTALASGLNASLEMAREGQVELRQSKNFAPLLVRRRHETAEETL
ncbi:segregation and condensation protein A [Methyloligella sp. GL2]|uniref:segregation and condensation protein A n=1 Tax=unclassified Methyloligella TaxID=2625955 RepID=UPI00352F2490